jgi:sec-independent protein translocase protein TatB
MTELVIIAVLALLLLGADNLPKAARTVGKGLREFRRATEDLKDQIETEIYVDEQKRRQVAPVPAAAKRAPLDPQVEPAAEGLPGAESPELAAPIEPAPAPAAAGDPAGPQKT